MPPRAPSRVRSPSSKLIPTRTSKIAVAVTQKEAFGAAVPVRKLTMNGYGFVFAQPRNALDRPPKYGAELASMLCILPVPEFSHSKAKNNLMSRTDRAAFVRGIRTLFNLSVNVVFVTTIRQVAFVSIL